MFTNLRNRLGRRGGALLCGIALASAAILPATSVIADREEAQFPLVVANAKLLPCLARDASHLPVATASVERGELNDTLRLHVRNLKPGLNFDLFTTERTNKLADGSADPNFKNFG